MLARHESGRIRRALGLGLVALGCAGPQESPEALVREAWRPPERAAPASGAPRAEERSSPPAAAEGGALGLAEVLERIAAANPTLAVAEARLEEARALRSEARAGYLPELSLGLDYLSTDNPAQAFALLLNQRDLTLGPGFDPDPGATDNWRKEVRLDWALFSPGRRESSRAAAEGEDAARLGREALERRLANAGVQAWIGLRAARTLERVALDTVAVVERRLGQTSERRAQGAALRADVLRLEVRLAEARQEAARASLVVREAESALNALMGRSPGTPVELLERPGEAASIGADLPEGEGELLALAERERLDLLAAAHQVRMLAHAKDASRASRLPLLSLFAAYDVDGPNPSIDTELDSYAVGVGLRLPLSARTGPRIERSQAQERQARARLSELALSVAREVRDAREALAVAERTLVLAEASVEAADEAYRIVAEAQDAGGATVTDVLEAENARERANVQRVAARAGLELARARLVAATGGVR